MSEHPASPAPHRLRQTRTARMARARLARHLQGFGSDRDLWWRVQDLVPEAWATVEEDIDCEEEKVKVTLRLDASVARLFRAMGKGYQARINLILSSYAQMRIGEIDRKARSLESILEEYGILQSEEARQAYLSIRDTEGLLEPESRATLDAAFGVRGDRRG
ncbi:BrnA antitoxin family protein [Albidovulum sp.]|uniref:BrnA antitoxin family protein n=1 Tax=Albidovulum sp. TaxID=1872424 RepID=UPI002C57D939|nr:BrnA antitoxin family protein [Paracoccaceae bacterium]MCP5354861.1 BrnA antitoxin family protein [Paracoccaceae bacterium]HRV61609.1 BrnA antitoxin family protein [Albidovulum sp.]